MTFFKFSEKRVNRIFLNEEKRSLCWYCLLCKVLKNLPREIFKMAGKPEGHVAMLPDF
jgi:hypothetical protein